MVLFTILLARRLGSAGFGEYVFITAVIFFGNALTTFGTDMLLIREIAGRDDLSQLPAALLIQLALSGFFIAAVMIGGPTLPNQSLAAVRGLQIYSLALIPLAFFSVFTIALRGKQRMDAYMVLNLAAALFQVAVVGLLMRPGGSVVTVSYLLLMIQVAAAIMAGIICTTQIAGFWQAWHFSARNALALTRASASIALLSLLGILYQRLTVYMLSSLEGATVTGLYSAGLRAVEAMKTIHVVVFTALYPVMAQASPAQTGLNGEQPWNGPIRTSWSLLLAGAGVAALALFLMAAPLVGLLYGAEFLPSIPAVKILAWMLIPFTVNTFLSLALLAARKERKVMGVQLIGLITLFLLNVWWIPQWGLIGACLACVLAESIQAAGYLYLKKTNHLRVIKLFWAA